MLASWSRPCPASGDMANRAEPTDDNHHDRRRTPRRHTIDEHGILSARIRPGRDVELVDVSAGGALIETVHRLLPGTAIDLHLTGSERRTAVRGRVLRCAVTRLRPGIWYRGAVAFDRHLPWLEEDGGNGYQVPGAEMRPRRTIRAEATHHGR
jgi:hypothetical protein